QAETIKTILFVSEFRAVTFTLQSKDLLSTVVKILKSCSLSTDHVQDSQVDKGLDHRNGNLPFNRPIRWDKTYYSFTGYRDPEEELDCTVRMEPALGYKNLLLLISLKL
ncbi:hypothetical protein scyTo_0026423, partial [Scyliorhinus torazame]|nr:hypothetical protein [Scyliorhinus torazame]